MNSSQWRWDRIYVLNVRLGRSRSLWVGPEQRPFTSISGAGNFASVTLFLDRSDPLEVYNDHEL